MTPSRGCCRWAVIGQRCAVLTSDWLQYAPRPALCLALDPELTGLALASCEAASLYQRWHFTHYNPAGLPYTDLA